MALCAHAGSPNLHFRVLHAKSTERMMSRGYLWDQAAACARAAVATSDPIKREILTFFGECWVNLANANLEPDDELARGVAVIEGIHTEILGTGQLALRAARRDRSGAYPLASPCSVA